MYSKIRWEFSIYDLSCTWVVQSLDSIIKLYVKHWLHLPQGANFDHITLPSNKTGLEFELPSQVYQYCKVSIRKTLRNSPNEDITLLYSLTKPKNIRYDVHVETENPKKALKKKITNKIENHLNESNAIRSCMILNSAPSLLTQWKVVQQNLPENIFVFSRKALIFSLANKTNLLRWKISPNDLCEMCSKKETQIHLLSNCQVAANEGRYTWRHDSILYTLYHYVIQLCLHGYEVFVDLQGYRSPSELFKSSRPDLVIVKNNELTVIELTCCFETNIIKSSNYKIKKYSNIEKEVTNRHYTIKSKIFVEITTLGFISSKH